MLELRPNCEHCNAALPPDATNAMICSYECTFCANCALNVLQNVCPNCGGGFCQRPVRPATDWVGGCYLGNHPAAAKPVLKPVDRARHAQVLQRQNGLPPERR
ncbi:MAG: DUF1272 domain-containing protein [Pseudomonadota bacterium]